MDGETERRKIRQSRRLNPGQGRELREQLPVEGDALISRIAESSKIIGSHQHVVRVKTRIQRWAFRRLRVKRPAEISKSSEKEICATTKARESRDL